MGKKKGCQAEAAHEDFESVLSQAQNVQVSDKEAVPTKALEMRHCDYQSVTHFKRIRQPTEEKDSFN